MTKVIEYVCRNCGNQWIEAPESISEKLNRWGRKSAELGNAFTMPWLRPLSRKEAKPRCVRCGSTVLRKGSKDLK